MLNAIILFFTVLSVESPRALLFAMALHEAAHVLCALIFYGELPSIRADLCGLRLYWSSSGTVLERFLLSVSGPAVNFLLWLLLRGDGALALYSLSLCVFNLFPVDGLDGGEICKTAFVGLFGEACGRRICTALTALTVFAVFALNCAVQLKGEFNLSLLFVTLYLIIRTYGK